jgi:hypothetical protein
MRFPHRCVPRDCAPTNVYDRFRGEAIFCRASGATFTDAAVLGAQEASSRLWLVTRTEMFFELPHSPSSVRDSVNIGRDAKPFYQCVRPVERRATATWTFTAATTSVELP